MTHLKQAQDRLKVELEAQPHCRGFAEGANFILGILDEQEKPNKTCGCNGLSPESLHAPFSDSCRLEKPFVGINPPKNYAHISHTHCYEWESPQCGLKGKHCCLCDIVSGEKPTPIPEELEMFERPWHNNPEDDYCEIQDKLNEVIRYLQQCSKE